MNHTSAPRNSLLSFDIYKIALTPRATPEQPEFGLYRDDTVISTHSNINAAVLNFAEHFNDSRSAILARVRDPEITITFSIR